MKLNGFVPVPEEATLGGAPIDAFQADAFRQNDDLFERLAQAVMVSPLAPDGSDGNPPSLTAHQVLRAKTINVNATVNLTAGVPLIWMAQEKIVIANGGVINANGKGASGEKKGDFGGAGGGADGGLQGQDCALPLSGVAVATGGNPGNNPGGNLTPEWASRALATLALCTGGAPGGNIKDGSGTVTSAGGAGGGIVFLCAPVIEFQGTGPSRGRIEAKGGAGAGNAGGGGGGLIVLIAHKIINLRKTGADQNVFVEGGISGTTGSPGTGGAGGAGQVLDRQFN